MSGDRVPRRLLGVWAHPDDETYLSAALMCRVIAAGGHVTVVSATRGELGGEPGAHGETLGARRERELVDAMALLGVGDVRVLGYPDGACGDVDRHAAADLIADIVREVAPDLVVTFGPDGITGHPDHVAVGRWTTIAVGWAAPTTSLMYAAMTADFVGRHRRSYPDLPLTVAGPPVAIGWDDVALCVEPSPDERRRKCAALAAHASQVAPLVARLGAERLHDWWTTETFRVSTTSPDVLQASSLRLAHSADITTSDRHDEPTPIAVHETRNER